MMLAGRVALIQLGHPFLGRGDDFRMQAGTDDELGAGRDGVFCFLGGGHGAGAEQKL